MASRSLHDLLEETAYKAAQVKKICEDREVDILIYCTYRTIEEQARLYRNGRSLASIEKKADQLANVYGRPDLKDVLLNAGPQFGKKIVTWAGPGQSMHNYRMAFDSVPIIDGKLQWSPNAVEWRLYGGACVKAGLEWAGAWSSAKREFPHAQEIGMSWRDLIGDYDYVRDATSTVRES